MNRRFRSGVTALLLVVMATIGGCIADPPLKLSDDHVPLFRHDSWEISTPEREGIDRQLFDEAYRRFFSNAEYRTAISLLVIRNGRLVGEGYCQDRGDIDVKRNIKSCTKSITLLLTGIATDRALITSLDERIADHLPEVFEGDAAKRRITIEHALTMRTGLSYENDSDNEGLLVDPPESSLRYVQRGDLAFDPGTRFHYSDAPPHLVGGVIARRSGASLDRFADTTLFGPMGITDYLWEKHRDGLCYGAFGIYMKPRDLAKIGQLCLQNGSWNGRQLVSATWIQRSIEIRAHGSAGPYGYYWWIRPDYGAFTMSGHGGNYVYIIPDRNMVIVFTAMPFVDGNIGIRIEDFENIVHLLVAATR